MSLKTAHLPGDDSVPDRDVERLRSRHPRQRERHWYGVARRNVRHHHVELVQPDGARRQTVVLQRRFGLPEQEVEARRDRIQSPSRMRNRRA